MGREDGVSDDTQDTNGTEPVEGTVEDAPEELDPVQAELEAARAAVEAAKAETREALGKLRAVSKAYTDLNTEMDAFRKRMNAQADQRAERKANEAVAKFFEPVENLKRSLDAAQGVGKRIGFDASEAAPAQTSESVAALLNGLKQVLDQFNGRLAELGLRETPGVGSPFDPKYHDALAVQPVTEEHQDGLVLMVAATGYVIGDTVLRPAQVVIGKFEAPAGEA